MTKKITALVIVLFLVTLGTVACGTSEDKDVPQSNQTNTRENIENKKKQVEKDVQEMEDKGIIDKNGKPVPGVDLRDYPGLG